MSFKIFAKGKEPDMELLRRADILRWLGLRYFEFDKIVRAGLLPWKRMRPGGGRFYLKSDVKRVFLQGFKTTTQWQILEQQPLEQQFRGTRTPSIPLESANKVTRTS